MTGFRFKRTIMIVVCVVGSFIALGIGSWKFNFFNRSQNDKKTGVVKRQDVVSRVTVAGTVLPNRRTVFYPPYNAYIKKLYVKIGDTVKDGAPVVSLVQSLKVTPDEIYPMRAPFSGTVVQVLRSEGEYLEQGKDNTAIVRIDDLTRLFILADVPESDVPKLHLNQPAVIKASALTKSSYQGIIREISIAAKEKKEWDRTGDRVEFQARIEILDKDDAIRPGMSTLIDIIAAKQTNTLALPHEYIEKVDGNYFVTRESGERIQIEVGLQNEEVFEITRGLTEGDRIKMIDFLALPKEG